MARRLVVLYALVVTLFCPVCAYADEGLGSSFLNGLNTTVHPEQYENTDVSYERDFNESYEPVLIENTAPVVRALPNDATAVDYVNNTVDSFNSIPFETSYHLTLLNTAQWFMGMFTGPNQAIFMIPAIGIVFLWWGVRKAIRMIMASFRKGRMTT